MRTFSQRTRMNWVQTTSDMIREHSPMPLADSLAVAAAMLKIFDADLAERLSMTSTGPFDTTVSPIYPVGA